MSQAWKLVEAVPINSSKPDTDSSQKQNWNRHRGPRGSGGANRGNRRQFSNSRNSGRGRRYQDDSYYGGIFIPDTPESRKYYAKIAVYNIEQLFSVENLCRDTFLRSYMDEAGYLPIMFVCNYVSCFGTYYPDVIEMIRESSLLEVDLNNETLRLKENWGQWLMPNAEGGMGLPLYTKQPLPQAVDPNAEYYYDYSSGYYYDVMAMNGWSNDGVEQAGGFEVEGYDGYLEQDEQLAYYDENNTEPTVDAETSAEIDKLDLQKNQPILEVNSGANN